MSFGRLSIFALPGLAAVLWVVPSVGTQGIGTLGQRSSHADRAMIVEAADMTLAVADRDVEATVIKSLGRAAR